MQQLKEAPNVYKTPVGQNSEEQVNAINQIFELFRFNYHNQFLKAFPDLETLNMAKRLWLKLLADHSGTVIMRAAEKTVKETSWLPTIHQVLLRCDLAEDFQVPNAYNAYIEACCAGSPKRAQSWSHPIVYHAGRATGWFFLANNTEKTAFPVFERNYHLLLQRLQNGESLNIDLPAALPETIDEPVSHEEREKILTELAEALEKY